MKTYHDKAETDIVIAKLLLSPTGNPTNDEGLIENASYHTQQAIEKELKYILHDIFGEDDTTSRFRKHNIHLLIEKVKDFGYDIPVSLEEMAQNITEWESNTRYPMDYSVAIPEINNAIEAYYELRELTQYIENEVFENNYEEDYIEPNNKEDDIEL